MKDKFNRLIATGLIALMVANFTACGNVGDNTNNDITSAKDETTAIEEDTKTTHLGPINTKDLPGDVWKSMKEDGTAYLSYSIGTPNLKRRSIPVQFLQEQGLLYYDNNNNICVNGDEFFGIFESSIMIDNNTNENDVYILLNYKTQKLTSDLDSEAQVTTWKLKYVLDNDDYQALLRLNNDFRLSFFIQNMDKIYEPEVISKSTSVQKFVFLGSTYNGIKQNQDRFPNVYIHDINYDDKIITYGVKTDEGYKFYDINLYESGAITTVMERYGVSREEVLSKIHMESVDTSLGKCLTSFDVAGVTAGYERGRKIQLAQESSREHKVAFLNSSNDNTFTAER